MPANAPKVLAKGTVIGLVAIPIWSLLPVLTVFAGPIPPLELVALTFSLGAFVGAIYIGVSSEGRRELLSVAFLPIVIGISGLFCYHLAYFLALQNAPPIETSILNYLWPVLIVLFSSMLPASAKAAGLTVWHLFGALTAFAGAALAITAGDGLTLSGNAFGYGMALIAALAWSSYSVATRLFRSVPSSAVTLYCAGTAVLAWIAHGFSETLVLPTNATQTAAIIALGLGPVGIAFYVWDYGCKHGDLRVLGVTAYFAPVFSTTLLITAGLGTAKPQLWVAVMLITGGALLASKNFLAGIFSRPDRITPNA